ncbi:glycosyltransferase [Mycoplasmoides alvi]|uniref:glycosyltransferase n=1 Tax=Mycoplasmoides alvi TaxID=78580 RepID=UPI00069659DB|nr:glycosyltransferase family 2 protein [Mycoplasmoides alvi]
MNTFSFIIAAYNSASYIVNTIQSVVDTKYDPNKYEIIIVDDGSTDNTLEICNKLQKQYSNIRIFSKPNGNWGSVINYVRKNNLVNNEYVVILDSDDLIFKNFFKIFNKKSKNSDMFLMGLWVQGKVFKYYASPYYWIFKRTVPRDNRYTVAFAPFSIIMKKSIFNQAPDLVENTSYQDFYLFVDLLSKAKTVRYTPWPSGLYNKYRPGNTMGAKWNDKRMMQEQLLHNKLKEINLAETLVFRIFMSGYCRKAQETNYKIEMNKIPKPSWLPRWIHWAYWIIYFVHLKKYVLIKK